MIKKFSIIILIFVSVFINGCNYIRTRVLISSNIPVVIYIDYKSLSDKPQISQETTKISSGKHLLIAKAPGYEDFRKTISVSSRALNTITIKMQPIEGLLLIGSNVRGAAVYIKEGEERIFKGRTPLFLKDLSLGEYKFIISKQGYEEKAVKIDIKDVRPQRQYIKLGSVFSVLNIDSIPSGARVFIDKSFRGTTPFKVEDMIEGEHTVRWEKLGYDNHEMKIAVKEKDKLNLVPRLSEKPGTLNIVCAPKGSSVYLNDQYKGTTPIKIDGLKAGSYTIKVEKEGYKSLIRTEELGRGEKLSLRLELIDLCGSIKIVTEPHGVDVYMNGEFKGKTDEKEGLLFIRRIMKGDYNVKLLHKRCVDKFIEVKIEPQENKIIKEVLEGKWAPTHRIVLKGKRQSIEGIIIKETEEYIILKIKGGQIQIDRSDIKSIKSLE
jgi:hypothetical protein